MCIDDKRFLYNNRDSFNFKQYNNYYGVANKKDLLNKEELKKIEKIENILKNIISGFVSFSGFVKSKDGTYGVRIQRHYDPRFIGVDVLELSKL